MAVPDGLPHRLAGAGEAGQRRLQDCLARLTEAEGLLAQTRRAEEAVASARRALAELCGEALGSDGAVKAPPPDAAAPAAELCAGGAEQGQEGRSSPEALLVDQVVLGTMGVEPDGAASRPESPPGHLKSRLSRVRSFISSHKPRDGGSSKYKPGGFRATDVRRGFILSSCCCGFLRVPIFFPDSKITVAWDLMGLVFIIFETFALPVYLSFGIMPTGFFFWLVSLINVYFIFDIPLNFLRGFKANNDLVVMLPRFIVRRYAKWVICDVVAGIPWEWLDALVHHSTWAQLTKMLRLLRVARLVRLLRLDILPEWAKILIESNPWLSFFQGVIRVLFILFSITHWAACIWFYVGDNSDYETSWITAHMPGGKDADFTTRYIYSLYFTLTTMTTVGYGDITPQNDDEVFFTLILLLVATVVFATLMGALTDLICSLQQEKHTQDARVRMLSHYMSWRHLPGDLVKVVRKHMLYLWETNRGYDAYEEEVKENLPPVLRKELCYHVHGQALRSATFLGWLWDYEACLKELASAVHSHIFSRGDQIFHCGQPNTSMFILQSGFVRLSLNESLFNFKLLEGSHEEEEKGAQEDAEMQRILQVMSALSSNSPSSAKSAREMVDENKSKDALHSAVLSTAMEKMQEHDVRSHWAASKVQKLWQRRKWRRQHCANAKKKLHHIRSRTVEAPAYFGEACLWVDFDKWNSEEPLNHKYSVRCESISEVLVIPRREIQELILRFSPWLKSRFVHFQQHVWEGLESHLVQDGDRSSRAGPSPGSSPPARLPSPEQSPCAGERSVEEVCSIAGEQLAALASRSRAAASSLLGGASRQPFRPAGLFHQVAGQPGGRSWATLRDPLLSRAK